MSKRKQIQDILWWVNSEVDKLSTIGFVRLKEILDLAQVELARDLARAEWLGLADRFTAQMQRNALLQIRGALAHINSSTKTQLEHSMQADSRAAAIAATNHLAREVEMFSSMFEGTVRPIALETASIIAEGKSLLWPRYKNSAARYAGEVGRDIRRQLAIGMIKGETVDQMVTRLAHLGGPKGLVFTRGRMGSINARAEMISEGLFRRYRHWGERLVRTEVVHAYNKAALIGMDELEQDDPGYFKRWDAAIDGRTCIICRGYDDLIVRLHSNFPGGFDHPPRHPNCRCACVIWRKEWDRPLRRNSRVLLENVAPRKNRR